MRDSTRDRSRGSRRVLGVGVCGLGLRVCLKNIVVELNPGP